MIIKYAMETEILKVLEAKYKFRANLINGNGGWGMLVNGKWTGVVGRVYNQVRSRAPFTVLYMTELFIIFFYPLPDFRCCPLRRVAHFGSSQSGLVFLSRFH